MECVFEYLLQVEDDGLMSDACNPKPLGNNQNEESDEDGGDKAPEIIPDESQPTIVVSVRQAGPRQAKNNTCIMHDLLQAGSNPKKDKGKSKVYMHSIALLINTQVMGDHDIGSLDIGPPRPSSSRARGQVITDDMVCV